MTTTYRRRELKIQWIVRDVVCPTEAYTTERTMRGPQDAFDYLGPWCREPQETMVVLLLNARMKIIGHREVSRGGLNSTPCFIHPIFQAVILSGAAAYILAHNHPSGDASPSAEDIETTRKLKEISEQLECPLLDHLILAMDGAGREYYVSLRERGEL